MVRPHLEYANCVWAPIYKRQSIAIENVQRRATKLVKELKDLSYSDRMKELDIPSLKHRRLRGDLIQTFKIKNCIDDLDWDQFFSPVPLTGTRNSNDNVFIKFSRTNIRKNCFSNRVAPFWKSLCYASKNALNVNNFKMHLDREKFMYENKYVYD